MAHPTWLKKYMRMKPEVSQIFDDLDRYREFCVEQGYFFDEAHLYNEKTPWGEMQRIIRGKPARPGWNPYPRAERKFDNKPRTTSRVRD
jgi:hypothetical protein